MITKIMIIKTIPMIQIMMEIMNHFYNELKVIHMAKVNKTKTLMEFHLLMPL